MMDLHFTLCDFYDKIEETIINSCSALSQQENSCLFFFFNGDFSFFKMTVHSGISFRVLFGSLSSYVVGEGKGGNFKTRKFFN